MNIFELLTFTVHSRASDLHLSAGMPPLLRVDGNITTLSQPPLSHQAVHAMLLEIMDQRQRQQYASDLECDFSFSAPDLTRFRVNAFHQWRGAAAAIRCIASSIPTLEQLLAPSLLATLALKKNGLILFTGPTGSGKSSTLAALINHINHHASAHVLTIEDPIEFIHQPQRCLIQQRQIGQHSSGFSTALRAALREDPDVIMVGELRDAESIRLALSAAETGHLVLATLHTGAAVKAIDRIVDGCHGDSAVRAQLSESLLAVIAQVLLPRCDGDGRIAAYEIMLGTTAIRNLIREGKLAQMYSAMQTGSSSGMQTLDQDLARLLRQQLISAATARSATKDPQLL